MLLDQSNIDLEKGDSSGTTPLFAAISENNYEITDLLLKKGADLNKVRVSVLIMESQVCAC